MYFCLTLNSTARIFLFDIQFIVIRLPQKCRLWSRTRGIKIFILKLAMSILRKFNRVQLIKQNLCGKNSCHNVSSSLFYSRKSDSKSFESPYKVVKSKVRIEDGENYLGGEGGPNWELLAPRGNRFFFPDFVGPAWQEATTTIHVEVPLETLVDFDCKDKTKLLFDVSTCPSLIRKNLHEIFPAPEVVSTDGLTLITLQYVVNSEPDQGASKFVLAAREICSRLRLQGYWADFMNPFSGKPFYSYASGKNLYKIDERFRGLGMKLKNKNNCLIITTDEESTFSGTVFTNAPTSVNDLKRILHEQH